jgi:hypothetical protein
VRLQSLQLLSLTQFFPDVVDALGRWFRAVVLDGVVWSRELSDGSGIDLGVSGAPVLAGHPPAMGAGRPRRAVAPQRARASRPSTSNGSSSTCRSECRRAQLVGDGKRPTDLAASLPADVDDGMTIAEKRSPSGAVRAAVGRRG